MITTNSDYFGTRTGVVFGDTRDGASLGRIMAIAVRYGDEVDAIAVTYALGAYIKHGGDGGSNEASFVLGPDEFITKIDLRSGDRTDQITFHTSANKTYGPYGGSGGRAQSVELRGGVLQSFFGYADASRLYALGFSYGEKPAAAQGGAITVRNGEDAASFVVTVPKDCLGLVTARTNAEYQQRARLRWTADGVESSVTLAGVGEEGRTMVATEWTENGETNPLKLHQSGCSLHPSGAAYDVTITLQFSSVGPDGPLKSPNVRVSQPTQNRLEFRTEDGQDNDQNDTWLTIDFIQGVRRPLRAMPAQIDPTEHNFVTITLADESLNVIAIGVIAPTKYVSRDASDFTPGDEFWYLGPGQANYSTSGRSSLSITRSESASAPPDRRASDAIFVRRAGATWYQADATVPDLVLNSTDNSHLFGLSLTIDGTAENRRFDARWYNHQPSGLLAGAGPWTLVASTARPPTWYLAM